MTEPTTEAKTEQNTIKGIDISNHEVVRQEYVTTQDLPVLTLKMGRLYVNRYAINLFPEYDHIQIYIDRENEDIVLQPVKQGVKDSFRWCGQSKRNPRKLKCLPVFYELYKQMGWDVGCRYYIKGREESTYTDQANHQRALYFSLRDAVCVRIDGNKKTEEFPAEWQGTFGDRRAQHQDEAFIRTHETDEVFTIELPIDKGNINRMKEAIRREQENESGGQS